MYQDTLEKAGLDSVSDMNTIEEEQVPADSEVEVQSAESSVREVEHMYKKEKVKEPSVKSSKRNTKIHYYEEPETTE